MKYEFTLPNTDEVLLANGLGAKGHTQKFFSNEVLRLSDEFTPFREGFTKNSATIGIDGTFIQYNVPYARFLWYGKLMLGTETHSAFAQAGETKYVVDVDLNYNGSPIRGSKWVERMWTFNSDAIIQATQAYMEGKR